MLNDILMLRELEKYAIEQWRHPNEAKKEAEYVRQMYDFLRTFEERPDHARVTLRRIRNEAGNDWTYGALALFAPGFKIDRQMDPAPASVRYIHARTGCLNHACDLLYKDLRGSSKMVYLPFMDYDEYEKKIRRGRTTAIEFMDKATRKTEDPSSFLMAAFSGYFSNERPIFLPEIE